MKKILTLSALMVGLAAPALNAHAQVVYLTSFYNTLGETRWENAEEQTFKAPQIVKPTFNFPEIKTGTDSVDTDSNSGSSIFETDNLVNFVQEVEETNTGNDDTDLGDFVGTFVDIQSQSTGQSNQQIVENILEDITDGSGGIGDDLRDALDEISNSSPVGNVTLSL